MTSRDYPVEVLDCFEIIATHYAHVFYNEIYAQAQAVFAKQSDTMSITEAYKSILVHYHKHMTSEQLKWINNSLTHIKILFSKFTRVNFITHVECVTHIADAFIPNDFTASVVPNQKFNLVYQCISGAVGEVINDIAREYLPMLVDHHNNPANVGVIKSLFVEHLIAQRDQMFTKFIEDQTSDTRTTTDVATAKRLRKNMKDVNTDNISLREKINTIKSRANENIVRLEKENSALLSQRDNYNARVVELNAINNSYKQKILQLISEVRKYKKISHEQSNVAQSSVEQSSVEQTQQTHQARAFDVNIEDLQSENMFDENEDDHNTPSASEEIKTKLFDQSSDTSEVSDDSFIQRRKQFKNSRFKSVSPVEVDNNVAPPEDTPRDPDMFWTTE